MHVQVLCRGCQSSMVNRCAVKKGGSIGLYSSSCSEYRICPWQRQCPSPFRLLHDYVQVYIMTLSSISLHAHPHNLPRELWWCCHVDMSTTSPPSRQRTRKPIPPPRPAYLPTAGSALAVDRELYDSIRQGQRELVDSFTLPIRSGRAWKVGAKSIVRISTPEGPQVGTYGWADTEILLRIGEGRSR